MDMITETPATKPARIPKKDAPEAFRDMAEKGTAQAKVNYENINAASTEAAELIKNSYSTAVEGVQDYNNMFIEFARANTNATFDFVQKLSGVEVAFGFRRTLDRTRAQAAQDAVRADQATCGARPERDARDR
jgi:hypothetical protein